MKIEDMIASCIFLVFHLSEREFPVGARINFLFLVKKNLTLYEQGHRASLSSRARLQALTLRRTEEGLLKLTTESERERRARLGNKAKKESKKNAGRGWVKGCGREKMCGWSRFNNAVRFPPQNRKYRSSIHLVLLSCAHVAN